MIRLEEGLCAILADLTVEQVSELVQNETIGKQVRGHLQSCPLPACHDLNERLLNLQLEEMQPEKRSEIERQAAKLAALLRNSSGIN
ncbi:MAG: hypothetical protein KGJ13_00610 [Patescibacteria group bacterium]|nr:hypothetical protein [Patescibacteria group bacterium]